MVAGRAGAARSTRESDAANAHEIKADLFKIMHFTPPFPNPRPPRQRSVQRRVAAARFLWALGFPADRILRAGGQVHRLQRRSVQGQPGYSTPRVAERRAGRVPSGGGRATVANGFDRSSARRNMVLADAAALYASGWTREQKVGFDAYRLCARAAHLSQSARLAVNRLVLRRMESREHTIQRCVSGR